MIVLTHDKKKALYVIDRKSNSFKEVDPFLLSQVESKSHMVM